MRTRLVTTPAQIRVLWMLRFAAPIAWVLCLILSVVDLWAGNVTGCVVLGICGAFNHAYPAKAHNYKI